MKVIIAVLQVLLLVTSSHSQQKCVKEKNKIFYYIYNANVETKTYRYCYTDTSELECKEIQKGKILKAFPPGVTPQCTYFLEKSIYTFFNLRQVGQSLCEMPAQANLLGGTVTIPDHGTCVYRNKYCKGVSIWSCVFWSYNNNDICRSLLQIYKSNFDVWTVSQVKFIENNQMSLQLGEKIKFCDADMWKTNYEGILVSEKNINMPVQGEYSQYQSDLRQICEIENHIPVNSKNIEFKMSALWYLYKYPITATVHFCVDKPCEVMGYGETMLQKNSALLNLCRIFCDSEDCRKGKSNMNLCSRELEVNLEKDMVAGLPLDCKYSYEICNSSKAFWLPSSQCGNPEKIEAYEQPCGNRTCLVQKNASTRFTLERQGQFCDGTVWYTDQEGIVVSDKFLQPAPFNPNKRQQNFSRFYSKSDLNSGNLLQYEDYFLGIPLVIGIFWILLKIGASIVYLCTKLKGRKVLSTKSNS